jgi:hypothetical protein
VSRDLSLVALGVALLLATTLTTPVGAAEVFRCVDEDGVVSYTDNADECPGAEETDIDSQRTDAARVAAQREARNEARNARREARSESQSQAAAEAADEEQRRANCQTQRDWLRQLQNTARMYVTDEATGERTMLDTEQREAKLQDARDRVAAACGN